MDNTPDKHAVATLRGVTKVYRTAAGDFHALRGVDLSITRGEFLAIVGESGSGKSTLLGLMSGIDRPSAGDVVVAGMALGGLTESAMSAWRGRSVGIVFQFFQLLPTLTAVENVLLPMDFCRMWESRDRLPRAMALLERLGVADQASKLPHTLSGGQQQRVAIARALANEPPLLLADEPTGNLDSRTAEAILGLFGDLVRDGQTVAMVTHAAAALRHATRSVRIADGLMVAEAPLPDA